MTNKYFIHTNKLCVLDNYNIRFYPDRFANNYKLNLQFYFPSLSRMSSEMQVRTYTFNSMQDVLTSLDTFNFNTLQHYQTNHPELFI